MGLIQPYPHFVQEKDDKDEFPLHVALSRGWAAPMIQILITIYTEALQCTDCLDNVPFHQIVTYHAISD
jgi:hypothetical protein